MLSARVSCVCTLTVLSLTAQSALAQQGAITLPDMFSRVLTQHPAVDAANARIRAAQGVRTASGAFANPMLSYEVENAPLPGRAAPGMAREAMTMANFSLSPLYQRWPRVAQSTALVAAAQAEALSTAQQLALAATNSFYRVARAQFNVSATRELMTWLDSIIGYNKVRVSEGVAAEADLIRSQLERERTAVEESLMRVELIRARAELQTLLGDTTIESVIVDTLPLPVPFPDSSHDVVNRADVRAARSRLAAAAAEVRVEKAMIVPEVGTMIGLKQTEGTASLLFGASMALPFFNRNRGGVQRAAAERDVAESDAALAERTARGELRAAQQSAAILTAQSDALLHGFLLRAEQTRAITEGAYREGALPLYQMLDAARAWNEARRTYYEALFTQHASVIELLVAQGIIPGSAPTGKGK